MVAIELRTWLIKELGADITMTDIVAWESLTELSERVVSLSKFVRDSKVICHSSLSPFGEISSQRGLVIM
ncbi:hypothetical protein BDV38DRAFT_261866 [Aspergillus pseudotamarii]|uniref:Carrier domain-containing protein n=1 Tax=Aspergillus pseudotamarii TaxID=132259 RepID=A0A5N6SC23_ASPPS|nr:uncharacterized protein BDV38DRAFT_261866 [Aspergillus pseudotamarii]KAE8132258.1 hypothetical protein BDV38DRAFT_261866 [Aspergillus pseudotamarii]